MKKLNFLPLSIALFLSCNDGPNVRGIPGPEEVEAASPKDRDLQNEVAGLRERGFEVSIYEVEKDQYITQKYFMVLYKEVSQTNLDLANTNDLQKRHLAYLRNLEKEGIISLSGPVEGRGSIQGISVFNTPSQRMADSIANLDPLVRAGLIEVEVYPWWVTKGGRLE